MRFLKFDYEFFFTNHVIKTFFCDKMCFELLLNNDIQIYFPSNDLKIGIFIYYASLGFWKKNLNEFSFILVEQSMIKTIHFKVCSTK
jgi:hypothetical protein